MTECDASRVAEIEKAVVEQAHCFLPPRRYEHEICWDANNTALTGAMSKVVPPRGGCTTQGYVDFVAWVILAGVIGGLVGVTMRQAFKR